MTAGIHELIQRADGGEHAAAHDLFASLYAELHRLAEHHLHRHGAQFTLGTTTLLHEAYLSVANREGIAFSDPSRFFAYASRAMRGLVIDYHRRHKAKKRGGEFHITQAGDDEPGPAVHADDRLELLGDALDELAAVDPALAELVDLHFFCGFSLVEIGRHRNVSERTVQRDWRRARLLLYRAFQPEAGESG